MRYYENGRFLVLDVGGTSVKRAVMPGAGEIISRGAAPTPPDYASFIELLKRQIAETRVDAVQIALPGVYDKRDDRVLFASNIAYLKDKSIVMDLDAGVPVLVENDANMAALGEYVRGFSTPPRSLIFLTLGTGAGGGVITDGELLTGDVTFTEPGHMTLVAEGRPCGCGKKGCMEKYCSVSAILEDYATFSGGRAPRDASYVALRAREGDAAAIRAFESFALHLAHGVSSLINIFNPDSVRIGGGLSELSDLYFPAMTAKLNDMVFPPFRGMADVKISLLKNDAAFYGGMEWIKRHL